MVILPWDYCKFSIPCSVYGAHGDYDLERACQLVLDMQTNHAIQELKIMLRPAPHDITQQAMRLLSQQRIWRKVSPQADLAWVHLDTGLQMELNRAPLYRACNSLGVCRSWHALGTENRVLCGNGEWVHFCWSNGQSRDPPY